MSITAIRIATLVLAFLLLYSSAFLYEDEEGKVQNIVEGWWVRLREMESTALSKQAAFMRTVATVVTSWFDRLFTKKLFSLTAICVSTCYTFASIWFGFILLDILLFPGIGHHKISSLIEFDVELWPTVYRFAVSAGICTAFLFLGTIRIFLKSRRMHRIWLAIVVAVIVIVFISCHNMVFGLTSLFSSEPASSLLEEATVFIVVCTLSVICDFSFIALNRLSLRWIERSNSFGSSIAIVMSNCALAALYVWIPLWSSGSMGFLDTTLPQHAGGLIAEGNILTALIAIMFVTLALIMIIHRLAWPLVERLVYASARYGIFRHKKALALSGTALLSTVFPGVGAVIKRLIELITA